MHKHVLPLIAAALLLPACTVGPDYEKPETTPPETWRERDASETLGSTDLEWWAQFGDPALEALIDEALANNHDLTIATLRVEEFAARLGITRSEAFPQVGYGLEAGTQQLSRETSDAARTPGFDRNSDFFSGNVAVGWELDLWGRIRRSTEAARANLMAAEENRRGVILTLVTSVATAYVAIRSLDTQLVIAEQRLESRAENVELFERQRAEGMISALEVAQVRSEYERTAATIPAIERDIARLENALSILLGRPPGDIDRGPSVEKLALPPVPEGLPAQVLERRPDIRAAEQNLVAANAAIGVAESAYFPTISLTGVLGIASDDLSNIATGDAILYQLAAQAAGPIFTAGRIESQVDAAQAVQQQALFTYYNALLNALLESENALVTHSTTRDETNAQARQVDALRTYATLAQKRYDNGYVSYVEVLDAERDLFDAELQQVRLNAELYASLIDIYRAFGGGWVDLADEAAQHARQPETQTAPEQHNTDSQPES
ncbi:efflux transporter outer membrane subunit [Mucisphaera calidilacus]|uniref:Outer membrane protein OprM n=1 Tax=Mucisphaera calidilacus TaxID=2527982 RepID=A0A518BVT5_9BACT|nr:efflux transporter outer membrane subunit [Mucisphaera calidilacus]QDU71088.1 Outer membrane protein OprM precursor [Mucisphaera calidilacus]